MLEIDANLVMPRLKMIGAKDFYYVKDPKRGWVGKSCPIGEGMCHWPQFLKTVAAANFQGPISLHVEYQIERRVGRPGPRSVTRKM